MGTVASVVAVVVLVGLLVVVAFVVVVVVVGLLVVVASVVVVVVVGLLVVVDSVAVVVVVGLLVVVASVVVVVVDADSLSGGSGAAAGFPQEANTMDKSSTNAIKRRYRGCFILCTS